MNKDGVAYDLKCLLSFINSSFINLPKVSHGYVRRGDPADYYVDDWRPNPDFLYQTNPCANCSKPLKLNGFCLECRTFVCCECGKILREKKRGYCTGCENAIPYMTTKQMRNRKRTNWHRFSTGQLDRYCTVHFNKKYL